MKCNPQDKICPRSDVGGNQLLPLEHDPARYAAHTFFELLEDDYFQQRVRNPSVESDAFFTTLRLCYPEKESYITNARVLLHILSRPKVDALSQAEAQALWHHIKRSIDRDESANARS